MTRFDNRAGSTQHSPQVYTQLNPLHSTLEKKTLNTQLLEDRTQLNSTLKKFNTQLNTQNNSTLKKIGE